MKRKYIFLFIQALLISNTAARAEALNYTTDLKNIVLAANKSEPTTSKAFDVFEKYPQKVNRGTHVAFKAKDAGMAKHIKNNGILARVFYLSGETERRPKPVAKTGSDCDVYITTVFSLERDRDGLFFFANVDEGWLYPTSSNNEVKSGYYYIVFEAYESSLAKQTFFGLRPSDAKSYFESGFRLEVADDGHSNLQNVIAKYEQRANGLHGLRLELDTKNRHGEIPCYQYRHHTNSPNFYTNESFFALCEQAPYFSTH